MSSSVVVGIDLGTCNSCVSVFRHGQTEVIANSQGNRESLLRGLLFQTMKN